jgi:hypothetical protein
MSLNIRFVTAGIVAVGLLCGSPLSAFRQDVTLRYRWTKGETLRYRATQQNTTTFSGLPGGMGDMTIDQSQVQVLRTVAEDVSPDGTTTLRQSVESMKFEMNSPFGAMTYDSTNPSASAANPMNDVVKGIYSSLIGEPFTVVMAPTGAVQKVEGFSSIAEKMFKNIPQDPAAAGMLNGIKSSLSDEAVRTMFMQSFAQFPDRPLKLGDTWNGRFDTSNPMLGGSTTLVTSTLKAVEGDGNDRVANIGISLTMKPDPTKPAQPNPMGLVATMGEGTGEGEQLFEAGTGKFRRSTIRLTMPMTMSGSGPDGSQMNMRTNIKSTITVELVQ